MTQYPTDFIQPEWLESRKEELPETELNEWGFPNENWKHIGHGIFERRLEKKVEQTETKFSFNGVRMNQEDFLENVRRVAYLDEELAESLCEVCGEDYDAGGGLCSSCYLEDILEKSKQVSED